MQKIAERIANQHERWFRHGKLIGWAIEALLTIVSPTTFYRMVRDEKNGKPRPKNVNCARGKPKELRKHAPVASWHREFADGKMHIPACHSDTMAAPDPGQLSLTSLGGEHAGRNIANEEF